MAAPIRYGLLQQWKAECHTLCDPFIQNIPKTELHVHIEGTLTPELRWKLAQRNNLGLHSQRLNKTFQSLEELKEAYNLLQPRSIKGSGISAFFEAYYGGMDVLRTEEDLYDLGMGYFRKAGEMNVRYCEVFFDIQAHTRRGLTVHTVMNGLRRAQLEAEKDMNVKSRWIACFLRDLSPESAMEHYELLLPYKDLIEGIGLDSNEFNHPPSLFYSLYQRAREDGFKLTCHCDVAQPNTREHIRQVAENLGGTGAERIDHGLDAASSPELVNLIKRKGTAMTLCPWAYVRHGTEENLFGYLRKLFGEGVNICIASDSPAYVEANYLIENLKLLKLKGGFSDGEIGVLMRSAVEICWAKEDVKKGLREELERFLEREGEGTGVGLGK